MRRSRLVPALAAVTLVAGLAAAQPGQAVEAAPVTARQAATCDPFRTPVLDPRVPTAEQVLGFPLGDHDVTVAESDRYLKAVSRRSPRVVDGVLARSTQGRPLRYAVVGEPRNVSPSGLRRISRALEALRDPTIPAWRAQRLAARTPAVLWIAGNVHGNEESGTDASLRVLYELAARRDCAARQILDDAIVVLLPSQNPDGREADTRRNAYGFDLNRDWFARTQRETDGKVEELRQLPPQLFVDDHEMGGRSYFFPPNADPIYHEITGTALRWINDLYAPANAAAFQRFQAPNPDDPNDTLFDYFNYAVYDMFYMGYGDTVPATGFIAAGMTYEKGGADSTAIRTLEQYTALWASLSAAGARTNLLDQWHRTYVRAYRQGLAGRLQPNTKVQPDTVIERQVPDIRVRHYFIRDDLPAKHEDVQRIVRRLQRMDVAVYRLTRPLRVRDYTPYARSTRATILPRGTIWVPMAQGQKHWIQAMLNEDTYVPFPYFYDVTAFSAPLLENVDGGRSGALLRPKAQRLRLQPEPWSARPRTAPSIGIWQVSSTSGSAIESSGWLRWWLDKRVRVPHRNVTAADITAGLPGVDVLVVPNGSPTTALNALGPDGRAALAAWVRAGGHLVAFRNTVQIATDPSVGLSSATVEQPTSDIPGSLLRAEIDPSSPLARGVGETVWTMYEYDPVLRAPAAVSPVRYPPAGDPNYGLSGYARGQEQLYGTAAVVDEAVGSGRVTLFGSDPNYRAFTNGSAQLLRNALFGPATSARAAVGAARVQQQPAVQRPTADALVVTVRPEAAGRALAVLAGHAAAVAVVRSPGAVSLRVDLGGRSADQVPWVRAAVQDVASLGSDVLAVRLP